MKNEYEIRGKDTVVFLESKKYGKMEMLISTIDLDLLETIEYKIFPDYSNQTKSFYAKSYIKKDDSSRGRISIRIHRFLFSEGLPKEGLPKDLQVDHFNHDTLDNRRINLRLVTNKQNQENIYKPQVNNKSGLRGVCFHKKQKKWVAQITHNKKVHWLGAFESKEEAKKAYDEAKTKIHTHI